MKEREATRVRAEATALRLEAAAIRMEARADRIQEEAVMMARRGDRRDCRMTDRREGVMEDLPGDRQEEEATHREGIRVRTKTRRRKPGSYRPSRMED